MPSEWTVKRVRFNHAQGSGGAGTLAGLGKHASRTRVQEIRRWTPKRFVGWGYVQILLKKKVRGLGRNVFFVRRKGVPSG